MIYNLFFSYIIKFIVVIIILFTFSFKKYYLNCNKNIDYNNYKFKSDRRYILNYKGGELEPEWQWAKNMSFIYTWVDGTDTDFADEKAKYNGGISLINSRDRSADELRYSLRSLVKYLPWHTGTIYILTYNKAPKWLDTSNPRIKIIYQKDIFPPHVFPTYDVFTIELFLDKVPGLTDRFLFFNDDFFINNYVHPCFFFTPKYFFPKYYRNTVLELNEKKTKEILKESRIHRIYRASRYFTRKVIREYFDEKFEYADMLHSPYPAYRDLFEPMRRLFAEDIKIMISDRFRNGYKPLGLYLYHAFLQYGTTHREFPQKIGGKGKARNFQGYTLPSNLTIKKYACKIIGGIRNNKYIKYGQISDNTIVNNQYFDFYRTHKNILVYNLNDVYTINESFYELSEYMMSRYSEPTQFEKPKYVEMEKSLFQLLQKFDEFSSDINSSKYFKADIRKMKLNIISDYIKKKDSLSGPKKTISDREVEEIKFLSKYKGGKLKNEWNWVKNISFVYLLENGENNNYSSIAEALKYSILSIEKYIPWYEGIIYIVLQEKDNNNLLSWIKESNSNIKIIYQNQIIPQNYSKTVNSYVTEMFLDLIPNISEKFVYLRPNYFFINYVHPRFFFSKEFFPKYNLREPLSENEILFIKKEDDSFYYTYQIIRKYFGEHYVKTYRYFKEAPYPLYRDLFKIARELFFDEVQKTCVHLKKTKKDFLPLYMVSIYNIYGTAQPYFPNYVTGYGKIRNASLPKINPNRTINFYGFDITSPEISNNTILEEITFDTNSYKNRKTIISLLKTNKLCFSIKLVNKNYFKNTILKLLKQLFVKNT